MPSSPTRRRTTQDEDRPSNAIDALAKDFASEEPIPESAEFDTDTFPRVEAEPTATEQSTPSTVPNQQRGGIRAFAERAMGGR